jgi:hypothetical protein
MVCSFYQLLTYARKLVAPNAAHHVSTAGSRDQLSGSRTRTAEVQMEQTTPAQAATRYS